MIGNQAITHTYGTTLTSSSVARNDLLASVTYPDSVSGSDVVSYAYIAANLPDSLPRNLNRGGNHLSRRQPWRLAQWHRGAGVGHALCHA
jgi:hypothetical protein